MQVIARLVLVLGSLGACVSAASLAHAEAPYYQATCVLGTDGGVGNVAAIGIDVYTRRVVAIDGAATVLLYDREGYVIDRQAVAVAHTRLQPGRHVLGSVEVLADASFCSVDLDQSVVLRRPQVTASCVAEAGKLLVSLTNDAYESDDVVELQGPAYVTASFDGAVKSYDVELDLALEARETEQVAALDLDADLDPTSVDCQVDFSQALR